MGLVHAGRVQAVVVSRLTSEITCDLQYKGMEAADGQFGGVPSSLRDVWQSEESFTASNSELSLVYCDVSILDKDDACSCNDMTYCSAIHIVDIILLQTNITAVSYTHLTLPTIYSV